LKEAGAEGLSFELLNRNVDQPFKYVATWLIDEWSKIGLHVTQRVVPTGPGLTQSAAEISTSSLKPMGHGVVNPPLDVQKYLPASVDSENYGHYEDQKEIDLYEAMLHAADLPTQHALMHDFEKSGLGGTLARQIAPDPKAATHVKLPHSPSMPVAHTEISLTIHPIEGSG